MKNFLPIVLVFSAGSLFLNSCATLSTSYVDDIYFNPETDYKAVTKKQVEVLKPEEGNGLSSDYSDESDNEDYSDGEYYNRLRKFHDDDYQGGYYDDDRWNLSFNFGFSPYGSAWGMGFGYGYPYYSYGGYPYYDYGYPYYGFGYPFYRYNYWYDPFYSWYYPNYGFYPPYYYGGCYECYYPVHPNNGNNNGYVYGPRRGASTNSGGTSAGIGRSQTREAAAVESRTSAGINSSSLPRGAVNSLQTGDAAAMEKNRNVKGIVKVVDGGTASESLVKKLDGIQISESGNSSQANANDGAAFNTSAAKVITDPSVTRNSTVNKSAPSKNRGGYTPSYTRPSSSSVRTYNNSGYALQSRTANRNSINNNNMNSGSNDVQKRSASGSTYSVPSRNNTSSGSTYSAPRSNNNSFSAPRSGNSSSGSNYKAPRSNSNSFSTPRSGSSSSGSTYTAPRSSSSSSSSGSSYSAPRSNSGSSGSGSSSGSSSFGTRRK